jgi:P27 family predicted phage terminase small subunit
MALRGRKPSPASTKILLGNPGKRPVTTVVPKPRRGPLACPPEVEEDPVALSYWEHFLATTDPGHLMPVDAPLLAELCQTLSLLKSARAKLKVTGDIMQSKEGGFYPSPWLSVVRQQREAFMKLGSQLSLTVAERNRVGAHDAGDDDPTDHFFDA